MEDYTYDPQWDAYYTGDPGIEENWLYSPPGEQAPPEMYNLEPDGNGGWAGYGPEEIAPIDYPDFSTPYFTGAPPNQQQQDQAVLDYANGMFGPDTSEAWTGEDGRAYTKDYEGNVFDDLGMFQGNDQPNQTEISPDALSGLYGGAPEVGAEPPSGPEGGTPTGGNATPPGNTDANGNVFVVGVGLVNPSKKIYFRGQLRTAMEVADIQHREYVEANERSVRGQRETFEEGNRRFNTTEDRLRGTAEQQNETARRGQDISARNAQQSASAQRENAQLQAQSNSETAQLSAAVNREKIAAELQMHSSNLSAQKEGQERAQRLTLIQALLAQSRGPNGPANYRMALELMKGMGLDPAAMGIGTGGGAAAVNPMGIPPATWDAMSQSAKDILLNAWQAQGGEPADFGKAINDQRPQGRPSGASRPRFAALAGA